MGGTKERQKKKKKKKKKRKIPITRRKKRQSPTLWKKTNDKLLLIDGFEAKGGNRFVALL